MKKLLPLVALFAFSAQAHAVSALEAVRALKEFLGASENYLVYAGQTPTGAPCKVDFAFDSPLHDIYAGVGIQTGAGDSAEEIGIAISELFETRDLRADVARFEVTSVQERGMDMLPRHRKMKLRIRHLPGAIEVFAGEKYQSGVFTRERYELTCTVSAPAGAL